MYERKNIYTQMCIRDRRERERERERERKLIYLASFQRFLLEMVKNSNKLFVIQIIKLNRLQRTYYKAFNEVIKN